MAQTAPPPIKIKKFVPIDSLLDFPECTALVADTFNQTTPEHYNIINSINSTKHVISQLIGLRAVTVTFVSRSMMTVTVARPGTVQVPWSPRCWAQVAWGTMVQGVPQVGLHFVTIFSCSIKAHPKLEN